MMKVTKYEKGIIENLSKYLATHKNAYQIIVLTSHVKGDWHDNEFDAHYYGYSIRRVYDYEYVKNLCSQVENTQFNEWYVLTKSNLYEGRGFNVVNFVKPINKPLREILDLHQKWVDTKGQDGQQAQLYQQQLVNIDFYRENLRGVDLKESNISQSSFRRAILKEADLADTNLQHTQMNLVDLQYANLEGADLRYANLQNANLTGANLKHANLFGADLRGAILDNILIDEDTIGYYSQCPEEGSFIGYKTAENHIVVLQIPADAKRSSGTTLKCRCDKAKVLRIETKDGTIAGKTSVKSDYAVNFFYTVGEMVIADSFNENRWEECSHGIHFFMNKEVAKKYLSWR